MKLLNIILYFSFFSSIYCDTDCPIVQSPPLDRRPNKNSLKIMQYNVEWLFIDYYSNSDCPGNGCTWKNESMAKTHLNYVSNIIKTINPDIINLCEIEGCDELNMLIESTSSEYKPYLIKGTDTSTGQNVGMLTKMDPVLNLYRTEERINYPISGSKCNYSGTPGSSGVSKQYITEFLWNNVNIAFISAHLIAYPTDPSRCVQREAQATVLQNIIKDYVKKDYEIIVMGDFNDFDAEVIDANNNIPTSSVLDILKGYNSDYQLYTVSENIIKTERYSDWYDENNNCVSTSTEFSLIDHILVSDFLRNKIKNTYIYHEYDEFCGKYNSDHYPIIIELE